MARFIIEDDSTPPRTVGRFVIEEDKPSEPLGERLNREIGIIPRQLGLTARAGLQGVGGFLDFASSPIRGAMNAVLPDSMQIQPGVGKLLADKAGLPVPENNVERVVGAGAELMASSAVPLGIASKMEALYNVPRMAQAKTAADAVKVATQVPGGARPVLQALSSNPGSQIASGGGSGVAGQYVKETGGDETSQLVASLAAGVATPFAISGAEKLAGAAKSYAASKLPLSQPLQAQIDITINEALKPSGVTLDALPAHVRNSMRADVRKAMDISGELSPDAIRRLADYKLTGAVPRRSNLTLDPAHVTQERNLAKAGINSKDAAAQELGRAENFNNRKLIENLNQLGGGKGNLYSAGEDVLSAIRSRDASAKVVEDSLYDAARNAAGRDVPLDRSYFGSRVDELLTQANRNAFLPAEIRNLVNDISLGQKTLGHHGPTVDVPFNVNTIDQLKTILATAQRSTKDGNVKSAIGLVRSALDETPIARIDKPQFGGGQIVNPATAKAMQEADQLPKEALDAFNKARRFARARRAWQESSPAVEAALNESAPDKFVEQFIIGSGAKSNVMDVFKLRNELRGNQGAIDSTKQAIVTWLKDRALNGAADEVGNFSQSAYNNALKQIGDRKLQAFFSKDEIVQLKSVGRVASYEQFQPRGSAVNNSNTAGAVVGFLDRVANSPLLSKVPFGNQLALPAERISVGIQAKQAMDVPRGLLGNPIIAASREPVGLLMSPAAFIQPQDRERKGLLFTP